MSPQCSRGPECIRTINAREASMLWVYSGRFGKRLVDKWRKNEAWQNFISVLAAPLRYVIIRAGRKVEPIWGLLLHSVQSHHIRRPVARIQRRRRRHSVQFRE